MNRKPKAILAVAMALAGTLLLVGYVRTAAARSSEGDALVPVLVVTDTIAAGTPVADVADMVTTQQVPENVRAAGAVTELDELDDTVASVELLPGEQITSSRFVPLNELHHATVPAGKVEVTVSLDPVRALGGTLTTGQVVGVVASMDDDGTGQAVSHMILNGVLVTRVQATEPMPVQEPETTVQLAPSGSMLITLAVDAAAAERVVFAAEHGRIWLTAEPEGAAVTGTVIQTKASVLG